MSDAKMISEILRPDEHFYWTVTGSIRDLKYQPMLLVSNAMVMTANLSINAVRGIVAEGPRVLFRVDYPVIANTVKHSIKYLLNVNKRINMTGKEIQELYERSEREKLENHSIDEYSSQFDKEYEEFENKLKNATYEGSSYTPNSTNQTGGVIVRSGTISHTTGSYGGSMYTVYTGYKTKGLWVYVWDEGRGKYSDGVGFDFGERE